MDLSKFNNKDRALIETNPTATLPELLALGLTEKGGTLFQQLLDKATESENAETENVDNKTVTVAQAAAAPAPIVQTESTFKPELVMPGTPANPSAGRKENFVLVIGPSGIPQSMQKKLAADLIRSNPQKFRYAK